MKKDTWNNLTTIQDMGYVNMLDLNGINDIMRQMNWNLVSKEDLKEFCFDYEKLQNQSDEDFDKDIESDEDKYFEESEDYDEDDTANFRCTHCKKVKRDVAWEDQHDNNVCDDCYNLSDEEWEATR